MGPAGLRVRVAIPDANPCRRVPDLGRRTVVLEHLREVPWQDLLLVREHVDWNACRHRGLSDHRRADLVHDHPPGRYALGSKTCTNPAVAK